ATTSSVSVVELVIVAYDRRNDWPTQPSTLMCVSLSVTRTGAALYDFLSTVTLDTVPGLAWISMVPDIGKLTPVGTMPPVSEEPEVLTPTEPISRTCPSSMPQPIW